MNHVNFQWRVHFHFLEVLQHVILLHFAIVVEWELIDSLAIGVKYESLKVLE